MIVSTIDVVDVVDVVAAALVVVVVVVLVTVVLVLLQFNHGPKGACCFHLFTHVQCCIQFISLHVHMSNGAKWNRHARHCTCLCLFWDEHDALRCDHQRTMDVARFIVVTTSFNMFMYHFLVGKTQW